jgi:hypothetical protein
MVSVHVDRESHKTVHTHAQMPHSYPPLCVLEPLSISDKETHSLKLLDEEIEIISIVRLSSTEIDDSLLEWSDYFNNSKSSNCKLVDMVRPQACAIRTKSECSYSV